MKTMGRTLVALMLMAAPALAAELVNVAGASNVALDGYDPVAFFTEGKPVNGLPSISAPYQGVTYFFATEEHKRLFVRNPEKYAPQFGGFCAYGVALGALFPVDISTWQVKDGKLYLNLNHDILTTFNAGFEDNVAKAEKNWSELVRKHGG